MSIPRYTTIKIPLGIKRRLEVYAKSRGLTFAAAIEKLLEDNEVLKEVKRLLEEQNRLLMEIREALLPNNVSKEDSLPSWLRDNPWIEVLSRRR